VQAGALADSRPGFVERPGLCQYRACVREQAFWDLIDQARRAADGDMRRLADQIRSRLSDLPLPDIEDYAHHWWTCMNAAYQWPVWDAAIIWLGWVGEDSFRDCRG
jgi:hypothetical protein